MSEPAFLPSNAHTTNHIRGTTLTRNTSSLNTNAREVIGGRRTNGVGAANQAAITLPSPIVQHQSSAKRLHIFKDVQQQQHSESATPRAPTTRQIHHLFKNNNKNNSDSSRTDLTTTPVNPRHFMPCASQPGPITISNGENALHTPSFDTQQLRHQQQPQQQQQQQVHRKHQQLPFNSLPTAAEVAVTRTRKRTDSASSTSTTSVTYLRNAAAAFIATAHQNHFQFPHKVLHPEIQPLSTAHLDLQHDFYDDGEVDDDNSFTSRELQTQSNDIGAKATGTGIHGIEQVEFMMEDDDDDQLEDDRGGRGFESITPPLDLRQINNNEEQQFWKGQPQYDPILFPSSTADAAAVDAIASSDTPLFPLSSYRQSSPHTTASSQLNSNLQAYWSAEEEANQDHFPSVQDHHPSTDHHHQLYHNHNQPEEQKQQQRQRYFFGRQDNIINNINMQDRSASPFPPSDDNYAYQQEVISDDPSPPPPPPLYLFSNTSFLPANLHASEFVESADRASWVSELSSGDRNQVRQSPYDHPMSLFSPAVDNGSGGQVWQDSRSEQDREVFEVCSRRLQRGYTPSQNIHKALVSSIRSSFLASLNGSQRASLMMNSSDSLPSVQQQQRQQQQPSSTGDEGDLQDFQQPWYQPQHLPYHASPDQEYDASTRRLFEREEEARRHREEELLETVAQLEKDMHELHNSTVELQASLRESEERNERMVIEHDSALRRVKEEHDHQIQDTKKRTKRFYDETMRKRQRDEDKRLEGLQEQLIQTQATNKDLRTTIRGLQRERVDAEQAQRDDLSVLCLFIENVLSPMLFGLNTGGGVTQLQAVGTFKHHCQPSTINTTTATTTVAKDNFYEHDLTPTTAVPRPMPLPTPSIKDTPKPTATTTTTGQCTSPRGQKCMSLLEQFQNALSISFMNTTTPATTLTTAVTTPTTPHCLDKTMSFTSQAAAAGLRQEKSPKTPASFRKTHARHNSTAITSTIATATKHGRHGPLTEEHLTRMHETERLEYLNSQRARKRYSDSSTTSSGHTFVAPPPPPPLSYRPGALKAVNTPTTDTSGTPRDPSSEKQTVSNPDSATAIAISNPQKETLLTVTPSSKAKTIADTSVKEKDRSLQQCLTEQHARYQKEIERIKQQCIKIYRQSLEDVRADVRFKIGQRGGNGGGGGRDQRRHAGSTIATVPVPVVATATAH